MLPCHYSQNLVLCFYINIYNRHYKITSMQDANFSLNRFLPGNVITNPCVPTFQMTRSKYVIFK